MTRVFFGICKAFSKKSVSLDTDRDNLSDCEAIRVGPYAIYSKPLKDSMAICLKQWNKNYSIAEFNPELQPIEKILEDGDVAIDTGGVRINLKHSSGEVEITGAKSIKLGDNALHNLIDERIVQHHNLHTHPAPGGATGVPTTQIIKESVTTKILKGA